MISLGVAYFTQAVGVTTTVPDEVPSSPIIDASSNEWYYFGNTFYHNYSTTDYSHLPSLRNFKFGNKIGLLLQPNGELHLYLDEKHSAKVATRLPVHKSLFGVVNVYGRCTKIKSEILSGELDGVFVYMYIHPIKGTRHNLQYKTPTTSVPLHRSILLVIDMNMTEQQMCLGLKSPTL